MSMRDKLELLQQKRAEAELGGGEERIKAQHDKGKMTARERLEVLLDPGSLVELDRFVTHRATDFGLADERYLGDGEPEIRRARSEEHTSELQSPCNLVCRLLLEKKKKQHTPIHDDLHT